MLVWFLAACGSSTLVLPSSRGTCEGDWRPYCDTGLTQQACCPGDAACNLADNYRPCGDGLCVTSPAECSNQSMAICAGDWRSICVDGEPQTKCCTDANCTASGAFRMCADGSCRPLGMDCPHEPPTCDGEPLDACIKDKIVPLCCPSDWRCMHLEPYINCGGGLCVSEGHMCAQ